MSAYRQAGFEYDDEGDEIYCAHCGGSAEWMDCDQCDGGMSHHDCGEDSCPCLYPEDNVECEYCCGRGGWNVCLSSEEWCNTHPLEGRERVEHGEIEWFTFQSREASHAR
jgi:hypothetical protein